jgi:hypothetical protein
MLGGAMSRNPAIQSPGQRCKVELNDTTGVVVIGVVALGLIAVIWNLLQKYETLVRDLGELQEQLYPSEENPDGSNGNSLKS